MIVLKRARGHSVVIDERIFITVFDFTEPDVCLEMSVPYDIMVRGVPRLFGHPGRSDDGEKLAYVEVAPCPKHLWLRKDDSISFNDLASLYVVEIRPDYVRLGLEATGNVSIQRKEVWDAIRRE